MREGKPEIVSAKALMPAIPEPLRNYFKEYKAFKVYVDTSGPKLRIIYEPVKPLDEHR